MLPNTSRSGACCRMEFIVIPRTMRVCACLHIFLNTVSLWEVCDHVSPWIPSLFDSLLLSVNFPVFLFFIPSERLPSRLESRVYLAILPTVQQEVHKLGIHAFNKSDDEKVNAAYQLHLLHPKIMSNHHYLLDKMRTQSSYTS